VPAIRTRRRRPAPLSPALKKLGERLREVRTALGMSQAQLGAPYFTRAHVSAIELGKIRPAMRSLEHMARKLNKPASYFLDDADVERARDERELEIASIAGLLTFTSAPEAVRKPTPEIRTAYAKNTTSFRPTHMLSSHSSMFVFDDCFAGRRSS